MGTKVVNTVGAGSKAAMSGTVLSIAPNEQHEAQALHFCWVAWLDFSFAEAASMVAAATEAPLSEPCTDKESP